MLEVVKLRYKIEDLTSKLNELKSCKADSQPEDPERIQEVRQSEQEEKPRRIQGIKNQ